MIEYRAVNKPQQGWKVGAYQDGQYIGPVPGTNNMTEKAAIAAARRQNACYSYSGDNAPK